MAEARAEAEGEVAVPMSLRSLQSGVQQLEQQLAERKAEQARAEAEAERQAKAEAANRKQAERDAANRGAEMERELPALLKDAARLASEAPAIAHGTRVAARDLLRIEPRGEVAGGLLSAVVGSDQASALLLRAKQSTERQLISAEGDLGPDHPAVTRLAAIECQLWRALLGRLAVVAGEVE